MSDRTDKTTRSRGSSGSSVWTFSILLAVASLLGCGVRSEKHPKDVVQWIKDCKGSIGYYDAELGRGELTNLEEVTIRDGTITDVSPLANLTKLKELNINDTQVSDVLPLANLRNLESLSLNGTKVNNLLPLANLTKLRMLGLNDTQVSDSSVEMLRKALPNCDIRLD